MLRQIGNIVLSTMIGQFMEMPVFAQTANHFVHRQFFLHKTQLAATQESTVLRTIQPLAAIVPEFRVSEKAGGAMQANPRIERRGEYGFILVWQDWRRGSKEIWGQLYAADGNKTGGNFLIAENIVGIITNADKISVDANKNGDFVVVWSAGAPRYDNPDIFARKFQPDATPASAAIAITDDPRPVVNINPDVFINDDGSFACAWQRTDLTFGPSEVWVQWLDTACNPEGKAVKIAESPNVSYEPVVTGSGTGEVFIFWAGRYGSTGDSFIEKRDTSRVRVWGPVPVNQTTGGIVSPEIEINSSGEIAVAWLRHFGTDFRKAWNLFFRLFDTDGDPITDENLINDVAGFAGYYNQRPSVTFFEKSLWYLTWPDNRSGQYEIMGQYLDANAVKIGANLKLSDTTAAAMATVIAVDSVGIVAWQDTHRGQKDIFMRKIFGSQDSILSPVELVNDDLDDAQQAAPRIAVNKNGEAVIAWIDYRDERSRVYMQRLDRDGSPISVNENALPSVNSICSDLTFAINNRGDIMVGFSQFCAFACHSVARLLNFRGTTDSEILSIAGDCDIGATPAQFFLRENGSFVAVWQEDHNIFARIFTLTGAYLSNAVLVNTDGMAAFHGGPDIAGRPDGHFIITWGDPRDGGWSIYGQHFDSLGTPVGDNFNVSGDTTAARWSVASVAVDSTGNFTISWLNTKNDSSFVLVRQYDQPGNAIGRPVQVNEKGTGSIYSQPDVAMSQDGRTVIVWDAQNGETWSAWGQRLDKNRQFLGENFSMASRPLGSNQMSPQVALIDDRIYITWADDFEAEYPHNYDIWASILDFNDPVTSVFWQDTISPQHFILYQNYPNPFNPTTTIRFSINKSGQTKLTVFDISGKTIVVLLDEKLQPGEYSVDFDGNGLTSGLYFYRLEIGKFSYHRKMLLIR